MPVERARAPLLLIADDEYVIREVLRRRLSVDGYTVETAEDGAQALAVVEREFVNILITDIKMPKLDGIELLRRTKAASPDTEVLVMTAYAATETAIDAVRLGAFDYLQKPFDHMDDVSHKVKLALKQQSLERQNRDMMKKLDEMNRGLKQVVVSRTKELSDTQHALRRAEDEARVARRRREDVLTEAPVRLAASLDRIEQRVAALRQAAGEGPAWDAAAEIAGEVADMRAQVARLSDPALRAALEVPGLRDEGAA